MEIRTEIVFIFSFLIRFHMKLFFLTISLLCLPTPQGYCPLAKSAAVKFLSFLQKLSKSNKIGFRAFSLDIITECMGEEWLWSVRVKNTNSGLFLENTVSDGTDFYARSLLSMARVFVCSESFRDINVPSYF